VHGVGVGVAVAVAVGVGVGVGVEMTRKMVLLVSVVEPVVTVTFPVTAPTGTVAVMNVVPESVMVVACVPPNLTTEALVKPWPRMPIWSPTLPEVVTRLTNGPSPTSRL
jgi:hypothetical protein